MITTRIKPLMMAFVVSISLISSLFAAGNAWLLLGVKKQTEVEHSVTDAARENLAEARFQVVQIQQFLTDSAVTGAADGIEDGARARDAAIEAMVGVGMAMPDQADALVALKEQVEAFHATGLRMLEAYKRSQRDGNLIMKGTDGFDQQAARTVAMLDQLRGTIAQRQEAVRASQDRAISLSINIGLLLAMVLVISMGLGGFMLYRLIMRILGAEPSIGTETATRLTQGNLVHAIPVRPGDTSSLIAQLAAMRARWTDVASGLRGHAWLMRSASDELGANAQQLAGSCVSQSQATQRIASNVEMLSVSVDQLTTDISQACSQVQATGQAAERSTESIRRVVSEIESAAQAVLASEQKMQELNQRTQQIAGIVTTIKSIADQTNLLALNAAIEAARAGESGRGFAVVADEVRQLAQRTSDSTQSIEQLVVGVYQATRDISESIRVSVEQVQSGVGLSQQALSNIDQIRLDSNYACEQVGSISQALVMQRSNASEVAAELQRIAHNTAQNSDSASALTEAAEKLDKIARAIESDVGYFKLAEDSEEAVMLF